MVSGETQPDFQRSLLDDLRLRLARRLLRQVQLRYLQAFNAAAGAMRFSAVDPERARRMSLVDVVREIPDVAVQTYRGFSSSPDSLERIDASQCLPALESRFPEAARLLLLPLLKDENPDVRASAEATQAMLLVRDEARQQPDT